MKFNIATLWEQGKRDENEDSLSVLNLKCANISAMIACVADGIGGLDSGETASSVLTFAIKKAFEEIVTTSNRINIRMIKKRIIREIYTCHKDMSNNYANNCTRMGTTCSIVCLFNKKGFILNIGDSRIYYASRFKERARLLTKDDVKDGYLIRCVGTGGYIRPSCKNISVHSGDNLLVCSDGFYKRQNEELCYRKNYPEKGGDLKEWLERQNEVAIRRGEKDNSTAIIIRIEE